MHIRFDSIKFSPAHVMGRRLAVLTAIIGFTATALARSDVPRFIRSLTVPGSETQMVDPGLVYFDPHHRELYLYDSRHYRIAIFDQAGRFDFDFSDVAHMSGAVQLAVDSEGRIYLARNTPTARLTVFEYNGELLRDTPLLGPDGDALRTVGGLVIDNRDRLFLLSVEPAHIYSYSTGGELLSDFALFEKDTLVRNQPGFGKIALVGDKVVIPVSAIGLMAWYTTDGKSVGYFGMTGGGPGELSFPAAVAGDSAGYIYVLDKHRHTILEFDPAMKYLRDIGGRGSSPGWFYHPTCLTVLPGREAVVGQAYLARVQMIGLDPAAAVARASENVR